ncbi:hypothetical protein VP01_166g13 [Puccinia sorghi]|uniref:DUF659 domain-containing protein n=1 Tax=Puccinia sorghi TaxID=27349 RepID=A0A0L6VG45_9BASI|nr:hypothetical protein VP01_166g13 [Puccinia sorghi]
MALKGEKDKYFLDVIDLHSKRHTAKNIYSTIKTSLKSKQIGWERIGAMVTNSPSVTLKLCRIANEENPHILKIHWVLHVFNLIAKKIINH